MGTLTATIDELMTPRLIAGVAARNGIPESTVRTGMRGSVASILDGLAGRADDPRAMDEVATLVAEHPGPPEPLDPAQLLDDRGAALRSGNQLVGMATADRAGLIERVARYVGVGGRTATGLVTAAAAVVMGAFGSISRARGGFDAAAIAADLRAEQPAIRAAVPRELAAPAAGDLSRVERRRRRRAVYGTGRPGWWLLALIPLVLFALWVAARSTERRETSMPGTAAPTTTDRTADRTGLPPWPMAKPTEAPVTPTEPTSSPGAALSFPAGSAEARFLDHVAAPAGADDTTWFELDKVQFATGSSALEPGAGDQLAHVAAILAANPRVRIEVGGYTDAAGGGRANARLSQARAEAVRAALIERGVTADRIAAEGYGERHQLQPSSGAEQANRRAAIRVTSR
jgi:outer membrane protein OmpA-like peptidoglycan-associated protein